MLHIATVHWQSDFWIDIQRRYLDHFLPEPHRVYAYLNDITPGHEKKFFYSNTDPIERHAQKLNLLAQHICNQAEDSDLLMFIDGDAFPISPILDFATAKLQQYKLLAVQRLENNGDLQPHPCFCITTVGFWKNLNGDWNEGHRWPDRQGQLVTDVGGNLLAQLQQQNIPWLPLLRTNKINLHPVLFGIYADLVYHHGAGFRPVQHREDFVALKGRKYRLQKKLTQVIPKFGPFAKLRHRLHPRRQLLDSVIAANQSLSDQVLSDMQRDFNFYRRFQSH